MGSLGFQTHDAWQWLFLLAAIVAGIGLLVRAYRAGSGTRGLVSRLEAGLEKTSHRPAWAAGGMQLAMWSLTTAFLGFMWDVAWHADTGRDKELLTVPHMLILVGLGGIFTAGVLAIALATRSGAQAGWAIGRWRIPYSAAPLALIGFGALIGFPLDDYWHAVYGIDVTLWSPTHMLMICGASLAPIAVWLMSVESRGGRAATGRVAPRLAGAVLIGLSTAQLEFDMSIAQWQLLYQPVLIALAAAVALVAARAAFGRGGALLPVFGFLVARVAFALLLGPAFGYVVPHFPLYLGEALCVEVAFLALPKARPLVQGLVAGALIGTVGIAVEWVWVGLWYAHPWSASLLPYLWMAPAIAVAGGVVGVGMGRVLSGRRAELPVPLVVAALAAIGLLLASHLPLRDADNAMVTVKARNVGATSNVNLDVTVSPASITKNADWFEVVAWQGHAPVRDIPLVRTGPGTYRSTESVPTGGTWKSLVMLARGDVLEAVPVSFPPDPSAGLPGIAVPQSRTQPFQPASHYLMRESHAGTPLPAVLAIVAFAFFMVLWAALLAISYWRFSVNPGGEVLRPAGRGGEPASLRRAARMRYE